MNQLSTRAFGDPYRLITCKENILYRNRVSVFNEKGEWVGNGNLKLTEDYMLVGSILSIPLSSIRRVALVEKEKTILIQFYHALKNLDIIILLQCKSFLFASKSKNLFLVSVIQQLCTDAKPLEEILFQTEIGCEVSGNPNAEYLTIGIYCNIFWILGGWFPREYYLSRKHAIKRCISANLTTSFIGYWGISGWVIAPVKIGKNLASLYKNFDICLMQKLIIIFISYCFPFLPLAGLLVLIFTA